MSSQYTSGWSWPKEATSRSSHQDHEHLPDASTHEETHQTHKEEPSEQATEHPIEEPASGASKSKKYYAPRICRICLEVVQPTFEPVSEGFGSFLNPAPKVSYVSEDPESGRLIRPCKCKGSQRYCHEGCLQAWRHADSSYRSNNYWECPTCKSRYQLRRIKWSRWISSTMTQILLTIGILFSTIFILGFIADPIINLYLDPYETITSRGGEPIPLYEDEEDNGWIAHFLKGTTSLGLLGFVKVFFTASWRPLIFGGVGRPRRGTGRDRLEDISWSFVIIGVATFLFAVWRWVRAWSRRTLENASERVLDVQGDDDGDELEEGETIPSGNDPDESRKGQ